MRNPPNLHRLVGVGTLACQPRAPRRIHPCGSVDYRTSAQPNGPLPLSFHLVGIFRSGEDSIIMAGDELRLEKSHMIARF